MATAYVIANWKMNMDRPALQRFIERLEVSTSALVEVVLCPSFPDVEYVCGAADKAACGGQNIFWEKSGAYTGEVSASQLKAVGGSFVILGHSERRDIFGETDEIINAKAKLALQSGLRPIICLGETRVEKQAGQTKQVVEQQVRTCLTEVPHHQLKKILIAYEPRWAISTAVDNAGESDSPESAQVIHKFIKHTVASLADKSVAAALPVIYGGSVNPDNAGGFAAMDDINGALVGGAAKEAHSFNKIITIFEGA